MGLSHSSSWFDVAESDRKSLDHMSVGKDAVFLDGIRTRKDYSERVYYSLMEKQCFRSHVGKLDCGTSPACTALDITLVLILHCVLEKINEVIGMKIFVKEKLLHK